MSQARVAPAGGPAAAVVDRLVSGARTFGRAVRPGVRAAAIVVADSARLRFPARETPVQAEIAVQDGVAAGAGETHPVRDSRLAEHCTHYPEERMTTASASDTPRTGGHPAADEPIELVPLDSLTAEMVGHWTYLMMEGAAFAMQGLHR